MRKPYANKHAHLAHAQITQTQKHTLVQLRNVTRNTPSKKN
eukprot:COSAG01_NODE_4481_length_4985_cov_14.783258_1_plen_40_part_10